jgi:hypothetical protein
MRGAQLAEQAVAAGATVLTYSHHNRDADIYAEKIKVGGSGWWFCSVRACLCGVGGGLGCGVCVCVGGVGGGSCSVCMLCGVVPVRAACVCAMPCCEPG